MFKVGDKVFMKDREAELGEFLIVGFNEPNNAYLLEHPTYGSAGTISIQTTLRKYYDYNDAKSHLKYSTLDAKWLIPAILTKSVISSRLVRMYAE